MVVVVAIRDLRWLSTFPALVVETAELGFVEEGLEVMMRLLLSGDVGVCCF